MSVYYAFSQRALVLLLLLTFAYGSRRHHSLSVKVFDLLLRPVHKVKKIVIIKMLNSNNSMQNNYNKNGNNFDEKIW